MPRPSRDEQSLLPSESKYFLSDFRKSPGKRNLLQVVLVETEPARLIQNLFGDQMFLRRYVVGTERVLDAYVSVLVPHSTLVAVLIVYPVELV